MEIKYIRRKERTDIQKQIERVVTGRNIIDSYLCKFDVPEISKFMDRDSEKQQNQLFLEGEPGLQLSLACMDAFDGKIPYYNGFGGESLENEIKLCEGELIKNVRRARRNLDNKAIASNSYTPYLDEMQTLIDDICKLRDLANLVVNVDLEYACVEEIDDLTRSESYITGEERKLNPVSMLNLDKKREQRVKDWLEVYKFASAA
ncbi:MAG: hypothetical protein KJ767_02290 [Nanoarchaeota archaeon]|nr:hypothetical protein [Nanoarchaeota archaeon]